MSDHVLESIKHRGYRIDITYDTDPVNPREHDNLGIMFCPHRGYNLGDIKYQSDVATNAREAFLEYIYDTYANDEINWDGQDHDVMFARIERWCDKHIVKLPLYLYDHGGVRINTAPSHCHWDSGHVGFIFQFKKRIREEYGVKRIGARVAKLARTVLEGEVDSYDSYIAGEVHSYKIDHPDYDCEDMSCHGFLGCNHESNGLLSHAKAEIGGDIRYRMKQQQATVKRAIRNRVPLQYRESFIHRQIGVNLT